MEIRGFIRFYQGGNIYNHRRDLNNGSTWVLSKLDGEEVVTDNCVVATLVNTVEFDNGKVSKLQKYHEFDSLDEAMNFIQQSKEDNKMELLCTKGKELGCKDIKECKECWNRPSRAMLMLNIEPMELALIEMTMSLKQMKKTSTLLGRQIIGDMESSIASLMSEINRLIAMVYKIDEIGQ